ncbi:TetR/AcrR family transcriptional regulator [Bacillus carboniphilus]|uniref:TetR/AcrR family transcriptional regulator n=1 Tax=Bacillus carboniphilus TaxID=86663 RepID=A0ABN0WAD2_9BACI
MPKLVDHEKRKKQIAEATWKVIVEQGMKGATVRNIAKEAGVSLGALRHYFSSQEELLTYSMELVKVRVTERVTQIALQNLPPKEKVIKMLLEMIPTTPETVVEMEVWFSFITQMRFHEQKDSGNQDGIFEGIIHLMEYLNQQGHLKKGIDKDIETERLYAIIDGLALHAMLEPQRLNKDRVTLLLKSHLDEIWNETEN